MIDSNTNHLTAVQKRAAMCLALREKLSGGAWAGPGELAPSYMTDIALGIRDVDIAAVEKIAAEFESKIERVRKRYRIDETEEVA